MKWLFPFIALLLLAPVTTAYSAEPEIAGTVTLVEGQVWIQGSDKKIRPIKADQPLYPGDIIMTGLKGELQARMADEGLIAVRPNSRLKIESYRANGDEDDNAIFSLIRGTFRSVTGWIGKFNRKNYKIRAATVTIGVRGTDHEPAVIKHIPGMKPLGKPGVYDKVNAGRTVMRNQFGEAEFGKGQVGFIGFKSRQAPTRLKTPPTFFKPSRHENRFLKITRNHNTLLQQRLQQRQQQLKIQPRNGIGSKPAAPLLHIPRAPLAPSRLPGTKQPPMQRPNPVMPGQPVKPFQGKPAAPMLHPRTSRQLPAVQAPRPVIQPGALQHKPLMPKAAPVSPASKPAMTPMQPQLKPLPSKTPTEKKPATEDEKQQTSTRLQAPSTLLKKPLLQPQLQPGTLRTPSLP